MPAEPNPTAEQLKAAAVTPDVASIVAAAPVVEEEAGVVQPAASVAEAAELLP
jgi:hypothetical protein